MNKGYRPTKEHIMKVGIATTLSIAGVLVAGAAAFAVNSNVLSTTSSTQSAVVDSPTTPVINAVTTIPGQVAQQSTKVDTSVLNNTTTTYTVGNSGSVVIDIGSGAMVVTNVLPSAGWSAEPAQVLPNSDVKVPFVSSNTRIEFLAHLVNGNVTVSVTSQSITPQNTIKPAVNTPKPSVPFSGDDDHQGNGGENERDDD